MTNNNSLSIHANKCAMICEKRRRLLAECKIALHIAHVPLVLFVWHVVWAQRSKRQTVRLTLSRCRESTENSSVCRLPSTSVDVRDTLSPTHKHWHFLFSFFVPSFFFLFLHSYGIPIATVYFSTVKYVVQNPSTLYTTCKGRRRKKTYQFTLDLQTFSYFKIIKYSSIDFNSPRRVLHRHILICVCVCVWRVCV